MAKYRVIDVETGNEDLHPVESKAVTPAGFLKLFYARWPKAPRGRFFVVPDDDGAVVYTWNGAYSVAKFRRV